MTAEHHGHRHHIWRFFRAGGFDQVRLDDGRAVVALSELDQKLWVALACPTRGIEFDERTLDLLDHDHDGRIRAPEMLAAARWTCGLLKNPDVLARGSDKLALAEIDDAQPEGKELLASARAILRMLGKGDADAASLQDAMDVEHIYDGTKFNGDGIIPVDAAEDADTESALQTIIDCIGAEKDRSGKPGVSQASADRFFAEAEALAAWHAEAEAKPAALLPLGEATPALAARLKEVAPKLDDFFTRCRLAAYDETAARALGPSAERYAALGAETLAPASADVAALPLAQVAAGAELSLVDGVNPAWRRALEALRHDVVVPLMGARDHLSEADWEEIKARLAAYEAWAARKPATSLSALAPERVRHLVRSGVKARIDALIAKDKALEPEMNAISRLEMLIRFQRDLLPLLNNFVSFRDFYRRTGKAVFQAGTLYLDARSCDLCLKVEDPDQHAQLATLSRIYLAYCRCTRAKGAETMTIAAAFTAGNSDNLMVGRNGVFYDRKGRDWDATIVKIIDHPISIRQAFWLPYRQAARAISQQVQKFAAARSAASQSRAATTVVQLAPDGAAQPAQHSQAFDAARFAGIFAAIGLAIGAIGTAIASVITGLLNLTWWQLPLAILGVILLISGPSVLIATLKLRHRNLGPILDACGWAVNTRLKINIPFGGSLTATAQLPENAERSLSDPYAEKKRRWPWYLAALVIAALIAAAAWKFGLFAKLKL